MTKYFISKTTIILKRVCFIYNQNNKIRFEDNANVIVEYLNRYLINLSNYGHLNYNWRLYFFRPTTTPVWYYVYESFGVPFGKKETLIVKYC